jgi:hypothetical protein
VVAISFLGERGWQWVVGSHPSNSHWGCKGGEKGYREPSPPIFPPMSHWGVSGGDDPFLGLLGAREGDEPNAPIHVASGVVGS